MQEAAAGRQQGLGVLALAIDAVAIIDRRGRGRSPGPLIAHDHPEPTRPGAAAAWVLDGDRGVIGMHSLSGADVLADGLGDRGHQPGGPADPVSQGRAIQLHALARVNIRLPVQGQVVAILGHHHVGEKRRAWAAALDGQAGHRRLADGLAVAAAQLGPHMDHDLEVRGHVLEHLALVVDDLAQTVRAAGRAGARPLVGDDLARQVGGQRFAVMVARRPAGGR